MDGTSTYGNGKEMRHLASSVKPGPMLKNIAALLLRNRQMFGDRTAYSEKRSGEWQSLSWTELLREVCSVSSSLKRMGFGKGDKMVIYSPNRREMLVLELAVMASGGVSVPIFAFFIRETAELLIRHSDARFLAVAGELQQSRIGPGLPLKEVICFDSCPPHPSYPQVLFSELLSGEPDESVLCRDADSDEVCLNMYTSGTMGIPKCVELTHRNILSQQAALDVLWDIGIHDRFLSYLPWHHSFGGIFELFTALGHGATYYLESGYGKDIDMLLDNWRKIKPTVFFSVPRVYQALADLVSRFPEAEKEFFHGELKFFFTAAAPMPEKLSQLFTSRGIQLIEGWGLTETSPCCTLTDPKAEREPSLVGKPIPGVELKLGAANEILVKGPNVMKGYYKNPDANREAFTDDGWFRTGDVGVLSEKGLKLIARKDRIFKLTNGEKVIPTDLEKLIEKKCHMISYALVTGGGKDYPVALLFPNMKQFEHYDHEQSLPDGCFCPRSLQELGKCLQGCLHDANCGIRQKFSKIRSAMIIGEEPSVEKGSLTPSMKLAPGNVLKIYKAHLENLYGAHNPLSEEVYVIRLDEPVKADNHA